jgi:hypothetical protein
MAPTCTSLEEVPLVNLAHARWLVGVLSMLIAVVGADSLLGLLLRQTRCEIRSLTRDGRRPQPH